MTQTEALRLALEALGNSWTEPNNEQYKIEKEAITAIKAALEVPEEKYTYGTPLLDAMTKDYVPPQRTWVGLTKNEVELLSYKSEGNTWKAVELAEAKLKEKNND